MVSLFYLLLVVYLLIFIALLIFIDQHERNYWRRALIPLKPCPFPEEYPYREIEMTGTRFKREGILSYSLYGNYNKYSPTLLQSVERASRLLPNWQVRVYTAIDIPEGIKTSLVNKGAEVIVMGPKKPLGHEAATWRFLAAEEDIPFYCLDADDLFDDQTAGQIQAWLKSRLLFCSTHWVIFALPMTANAWGARPGSIPDIRQRLARYCEHGYGFDEAFLKKEVWPIAEEKGCWIPTWIRLDILLPFFWVILIVLMIITLYVAYKN